jgi:hypothetical protein
MAIYWGFFEEWTIWTDYTMAWVRPRSSLSAVACLDGLLSRSNSTFSSIIGIV